MLSLEKKSQVDLAKTVQITLEKNNLTNVVADVVLALDVSGSMDGLYRQGQVQLAAERVVALAGKWDPDGQVDMFVFDTGIKAVGQMSINNYDGWIQKNIYQRGYVGGGTNYAPAINEIVKKYSSKSGGFLGFGSKQVPAAKPVYVLFVTDGECSDPGATKTAMVEASKHGIFFQFVGLGNYPFKTLRELDDMPGRTTDNADFFELNGSVSDEQLYQLMLQEFPGWITRAKGLQILA